MRIGECALCRRNNVELQRSHILPRCFYRRVRDETAANPNPLHIEYGRKVQTSLQITQDLLCRDCEQMLANGCEAYVANEVAYQSNGDCPLYRTLGYTSVVTDPTRPNQVCAKQCDNLNVQHIVDFAVSIFWRSAVATVAGTHDFALPATVTESLRSRLLNHGNELANIPMTLTVLDQPRGLNNNPFHRMFMVPGTGNGQGYRHYGFLLCGLCFRMAEGNNIPREFFDTSLCHAIPPHLAFASATDMRIVQNIAELARTTSP